LKRARQLAKLLSTSTRTRSCWNLPRGGVIVAAEVTAALEAPLDVWVVRKVGAPGNQSWGSA
jgi:putative phosphoribosyl transferase